MPLKDGFETTIELRRDFQLKTPIIALTANAISGERDQCLQVGMNEYMSKPFQPEILYKKILELVQGYRTEISVPDSRCIFVRKL
jgi:CheY-like chemotaxis protein